MGQMLIHKHTHVKMGSGALHLREPQQLALLAATEHTASVAYPALPSKLNLLGELAE